MTNEQNNRDLYQSILFIIQPKIEEEFIRICYKHMAIYIP